MSESIYAVVAYIARYWFALLALIILWRAVQWIRKDASQAQRQRSRLPDAGFIGEWVVVATDAEAMPEGMVISATRDGWVGSARACDVRIKSMDVPARAARFYLRKDGLHMLPRREGLLEVDGEAVLREAVLRHGATLSVGGVTLQLRLFAGILLTDEAPAAKKRQGRATLQPDIAIETAAEPTDTVPATPAAQGTKIQLPKPALKVKINANRSNDSGTTAPKA